jgi:hypothetical protein
MLTKAITAGASGDNQAVAGVAGKRIRVLGFVLSFSGTVNAKFTDGAGGTALTGLLYGAADAAITAPCVPPVVGSQPGWFATSQGNDLTLNLSAATAVGGFLLYDLVP